MNLVGYAGSAEMALRASRRKSAGPYARAFFGAFAKSFDVESKALRSKGDKNLLARSIANGMAGAVEVLRARNPRIQECSFRIPVQDLKFGKSPDYAFTNGRRHYVIEQKSMLSFNEFAPVLLQGMLAKKAFGAKNIRYAALFHYFKQSRSAYTRMCELDGVAIVDHLCLLVPEKGYREYDPAEADGLFNDIESWLK